MSSSLATLFLVTCFSFVSSTFITVEVQRGAEVTLQCSNSSSLFGRLWWFHISDHQPNISQICSMFGSKDNVTYYSPARRDKYTMTSNNSTLFLTVKKVVLTDGGLYFCGEKMKEKTVIFTATYLKIQENVSINLPNFPILIMAGVISLLVLLVGGLLLKIHKLLKGRTQEDGLEQQQENAESPELTYATVNFRAQRRPSNKDPQPNVVYAATK